MINILEQVVLYCLSKLGKERSSSSVFHLLNGKKSSQTIQDSHLFQVDSFFHTAHHLTREQYESIISKLIKHEFMYFSSNQQIVISESGQVLINELYSMYPFLKNLQGGKYHNCIQFWERLSLLIQVCSNQVNKQISYIPVQKNKDTQNWIKHLFSTSKGNSKDFPHMLLSELQVLLESSELEVDPSVLVARFSGFQSIGLTEMQTIEMLGIEENSYRFQFQALLHYLMSSIEQNPSSYPLLARMAVTDELQQLTSSAKKTFDLIKKGKGIVEIGRIRRLKESTIQDHIVEIALFVNGFNIDRFVEEPLQERIKEAIQKASSKQLRKIREIIDVDYFQIRLVIAKFGDLL
ncbi:helix-turn-helix domain-containing protein [Robertmurraya sp.]|uniref:helix-turn-helix domain-containing protein n=1 Tax=Robertmurraya sp. TaxID=2837525 RepID=UPI0037037A58